MLRKGRGHANVFYPIGISGGGDPENVTLRLKKDGTIDITTAVPDLGQGFKMAAIQITAEVFGIGTENFSLDNSNTDSCAYCVGSGGSRSTYMTGNAALDAGKKLIEMIKSRGAELLTCEESEVDYEAGKVFKKSDPSQAVTLKEVGEYASNFGKPVYCVGAFRPPKVARDRETGKGVPSRTVSWGATIADVEVDDETGVVTVENLYSCYECGTIVNPLGVQGQADGGDMMGIGMGLYEDLTPGYPDNIDREASNFTDYIIPTFMDMPKHSEVRFIKNYDHYGPYGVKGFGEMVNNTQPAAIVNAIYDAVGVWIDSIPATPEKVLRLLDEKNK